jgi:hypothetical protein
MRKRRDSHTAVLRMATAYSNGKEWMAWQTLKGRRSQRSL